jgi:methionyl-tRNA formyltransferase
MKSVLLTTETAHHLYFARRVGETFPWRGIIIETGHPTAPFETRHPFEDERDAYERDVLLAGDRSTLKDVAETIAVERINEAGAVAAVRRFGADVGIVFGTRKLGSGIIDMFRGGLLNLHGGNPEEYRGLDTHLWTIYHEDFPNLVTALHKVDQELDTGDIVEMRELPLETGMGLAQLRSVNTGVCVSLVLAALDSLQRGRLMSRRQSRRGRYYSFMPSVLKEACVAKFRKRVSKP